MKYFIFYRKVLAGVLQSLRLTPGRRLLSCLGKLLNCDDKDTDSNEVGDVCEIDGDSGKSEQAQIRTDWIDGENPKSKEMMEFVRAAGSLTCCTIMRQHWLRAYEPIHIPEAKLK